MPDTSPSRHESASIGDVVDLVRDYAKQETLGPLKGAGRWLALGAAGAVFIGLGSVFVLIGVLRLLQTETSAFDGGWSWVPYLIVLVAAAIVAAIALSRVKKATLGKEPGHGSR
ncbi:MAG: phage holin family protein [Actinomycetota bacterium]